MGRCACSSIVTAGWLYSADVTRISVPVSCFVLAVLAPALAVTSEHGQLQIRGSTFIVISDLQWAHQIQILLCKVFINYAVHLKSLCIFSWNITFCSC